MALFNEENTGRLVGLPFTLAAVATDHDGWKLDEREQKELAATGSVALNEWVRVEPKYLALLLFSLSLVGVASAKAITYQGTVRARKIQEEMRRRAAAQTKAAPAAGGDDGKKAGEEGGWVAGPPPKPPALPS